jgi:DNA-binding MarR family transcriptional regulator
MTTSEKKPIQTSAQHREVLSAIRRIIRATDIHSKKMIKESGLTSAQILILQTLIDEGQLTAAQLAERISLSQATVTTILDRLESRGLVIRERDTQDRRKVRVLITDEGQKVWQKAPTLLQTNFIEHFDNLKDWEQTMIVSALQRVADLMNAESIDASPVLEIGAIDSLQTQVKR